MGGEHESPSMAGVQAEGCLVLDEAEQVGRGQTLRSGRPCEEFGFYFFVCSGKLWEDFKPEKQTRLDCL